MPDFQKIFNHNYPGMDTFIDKVLTPIFKSGTIDKHRVPINILADPAKRERARLVNIKSIVNVAQIDAGWGSPIELYDVTLKDNCQLSRCRVGIQQIIRAEVQNYSNIFILFHYESPEHKEWRFSYAFKGSSLADTTTAKRYTYLFGEQHNSRTANQRFNELCEKEIDDDLLQEAFSVEALSKEFFDKYQVIYEKFCQFLYDHQNDTKYFGRYFQNCDEDECDDYIKKMLGRILFLQFIQKKGWMCGDIHYMQNLFKRTKYQNDFLDRVLEPLFFGVLNTDKPARRALFKEKNWDLDLLREWQNIPYLNGGLFEPDSIDPPKSIFKKSLFVELFDLFDQFNFTIDENDPEDAEVGVDPEMLGKIFENQLKDNKDKGAFYTPKEIVQYMCRESLIAYITTSCPQIPKDKIRKFVLTHELDDEEYRNALDVALREVKICDPAIGSGAFPMGMLHELYKCHTVLSDDDFQNPTELKSFIIQNNIYGVDIEKGAVDIARLRFWLSLVVTEDCQEGEEPEPLPNLDYKIMQGNSLFESWQGMNLQTLAQTKEMKIDNLQISLFSEELDFTRFKLGQAINDYYACHDHNQKKEIQKQIEEYITYQLQKSWHNKKARLHIDFDLRANDQFFLWRTWFVKVFKNGGFHIVIGNPPYVRQELLSQDYKRALNQEYPHVGNGTADLYVYFFGLGVSLLRKKGVLTFITSNKYLKTLYGRELRNYLSTETTIDLIIDFFELPVFKSASVDAAITKVLKTTSLACTTRYFPIQTLEHLDLDQTTQGPYLVTLRDSTEWKFVPINEERLLRKIEGPECIPLGTFVKGRIYSGIKTGLNKAFVIKDKEVAESLLDSESRPLIKRYAHSTDITTWYLKDEQYFLATGFDLNIKRLYPTAFAYLRQFRSELEVRGDRGKYYYNLRACAYYDEFEEEKIIYIHTAKNHQFYFDTEGHYINNSCYMIITKSRFLFCFLNSKLFRYYKRIKFVAFGDGQENGRCKLDYNKMISVPIMKDVDEAPFKALFKRIQAIKKENPQADTTADEAVIDQLIYSIYGLTPEEIAIVEGTATSTEPEE